MDLDRVAGHLDSLAIKAKDIFASMSDSDWTMPYAGSSAWTRGELLGHLIDSAINNQQRFARALIEDELHFPSYPQNEMVRVQNHRDAPVELLAGLWTYLNRYVARLLLQVPKGKRATVCVIGSNTGMTLEQLAADYLAHLEHHLKQLVGNEALPYSNLPWPPPERWREETRA
jgi:hypothetical protein